MNHKAMRRSRRKQQISLFTNIVFCIIALAALTGCIFFLLQNYSLRNEAVETMGRVSELEGITQEYIYSQTDLDSRTQEAAETARNSERAALLGELRQRMMDGESTVSVLRDFYPENVVVYADSQYHFFPIQENLKKHSYITENFVLTDDNEITYMGDENIGSSIRGIDVSRHQGKIDWSEVSGDGISYAFIRAGYRGSVEGKLVEDDQFTDNIEGALDNGIQVGVYFYTQALTAEEAREEAEFVVDLLQDYEITYPVVLDLEEVVTDNARTQNMTREEYTEAALAFCETIRDAGYTPMIYGNLKTFFLMLDLEKIEGYDKWFAYYDESIYFPYDFAVWQYSSKGSVDGIGGDVDMNVCMKDYGKESGG